MIQGNPLVGATIAVKGAQVYAVTDVQGQFNISIKKELPVLLQVNSVGYKRQEIEVYEITEESLEVVLQNDNVLNEIVVVGYGEQKKIDLVGSVTKVEPWNKQYQNQLSIRRFKAMWRAFRSMEARGSPVRIHSFAFAGRHPLTPAMIRCTL